MFWWSHVVWRPPLTIPWYYYVLPCRFKEDHGVPNPFHNLYFLHWSSTVRHDYSENGPWILPQGCGSVIQEKEWVIIKLPAWLQVINVTDIVTDNFEQTINLNPEAVRGHFDRIGHFRILVIGRSKVGKTTLLQRICNTTELPEIYNSKGEKVKYLIMLHHRSLMPGVIRSLIPQLCMGH